MQTLKQTLRTLWRDRGFSGIAVAMLALGIGASTAIFSAVNAVLLQSSYEDADRLYVLEQVVPDLADRYPTGELPVNAGHFAEWRKACTACLGLGLAAGGGGSNLTGDGVPERIRTLGVTHDLLSTLGVTPALGRTISPEDDKPDAQPVILLTNGFWRRRYSADPEVVGREIVLNFAPVTIIGVLPPDFEPIGGEYLGQFGSLAGQYEGVRPLRLNYSAIRPAGNFNFGGVVRLKDGATPEQATAQMNASIRGFVEEFDREMGVRLRPLDDAVVGGAAAGLWMLLAAVGGVLLIVCVNVGNLMFVRVERRGREAAVRRAMGATPLRLALDVVREGFVLALLGGVAGILVAQWAIGALVAVAPEGTPRLDDIRLDWTALAFAVVVMSTAALLTSLAPALSYRSVRGALVEAQASGTASSRNVRSRSVLVAFETGLSAMLLIAAVLMGSSLFRLLSVDKGFSGQVLAFDLVLPPGTYPAEGGDRGRFQDQLVARLASQPGVSAVGFTTRLPLEGATWVDTMTPAGSAVPDDEQLVANFRFVSEDYWRAMGIRLLEGRYLQARDRAEPRIVISAEAARQLWPGESALGKSVSWDADDDAPYEVVGVVADVKTGGLRESTVPIGYLSYWALPSDAVSYSVRTSQDSTGFAGVVRDVVRGIDPTLPVTNLRTMDQVSARASAEERFQTTLAGLFSLTALGLASLGIYGVVSYAAARRTKEIGLRMAVGAEARRITAMVLGQGMKPIVAGLAGGMIAAAIAARWMESLLYEVSASDPLVYAVAGCVLLATASVACYVPARRASRIDPMTALRQE